MPHPWQRGVRGATLVHIAAPTPRSSTLGAIAQLGERVVRNDEVRSSILLGSTKQQPEGARRRPEYLQKQGFRPFSLASAVRHGTLQLVRRWGHILGHLLSAPKTDAPTFRPLDSARQADRQNPEAVPRRRSLPRDLAGRWPLVAHEVPLRRQGEAPGAGGLPGSLAAAGAQPARGCPAAHGSGNRPWPAEKGRCGRQGRDGCPHLRGNRGSG